MFFAFFNPRFDLREQIIQPRLCRFDFDQGLTSVGQLARRSRYLLLLQPKTLEQYLAFVHGGIDPLERRAQLTNFTHQFLQRLLGRWSRRRSRLGQCCRRRKEQKQQTKKYLFHF
jgi:hypothetical protein